MNSLLSAPVDCEGVPSSIHAGENPTPHRCAPIITRMEWCQLNRRKARTEAESEGWAAEEEGLRDALLHRDGIDKYRYSSTRLRDRYQLGLEDGQTLLRVALLEAIWQAQSNALDATDHY